MRESGLKEREKEGAIDPALIKKLEKKWAGEVERSEVESVKFRDVTVFLKEEPYQI